MKLILGKCSQKQIGTTKKIVSYGPHIRLKKDQAIIQIYNNKALYWQRNRIGLVSEVNAYGMWPAQMGNFPLIRLINC